MKRNTSDIVIALNISPDEYLRVYQGAAKYVVARSQDGRTIQFPVSILQKFLTHEGIQGVFVIHHDGSNKFVSIERITTI